MTLHDAKANADIVAVIEAHGITLTKKVGAEFKGLCPFHADSRPSLNVNQRKQVFFCPVCDTKGDVLDFVMKIEGCTVLEARDKITGQQFTQHVQPPAGVMKKGQPQDWLQVTPAPVPGQITHHVHGRPAKVWEYRDRDGALLGLICRFDTPDGKEILPYTYRENAQTDRRTWMFRGFDRPRPLYALPKIYSGTKATVIVVEGEKTADAAQRLFPNAAVTTWQGGARAINATDWKPLAGRRVICWPDNDQPGIEAMIAVAGVLAEQQITTDVKIVLPPESPKGWDLADGDIEEWTPERAKAYALANLHGASSDLLVPRHPVQAPNLPQVESSAPAGPTPEAPIETAAAPQASPAAPHLESGGDNRYFEVLGFVKTDGKQLFAFYIKAARMVVYYSASALASKTNLITLGPLEYWEHEYPTGKRSGGGFSIEMAVQVLISYANRRGVFTPRMMRGRGAWFDGGRVVLHLGSHLMVNGGRVELGNFHSRYVYEAGEAMEIAATAGLETTEAVKLMRVTRLLNWEREINAYLLAGWCVIAPFCGALRWRPHIWLTGGAGTGKSWVFREIVRRLLGGACLAVQSETSEAGLRQMLASDAVPVVFDEAEGETRHSLERMEHVLALMRAASSSDGGIVAKGTSSGRGQTFEIRSCFACASINSPVTLQADRTRVTPLGLVQPAEDVRAARWAELQQAYAEVITDDFVAGLQARTVRLLPTLLRNADIFAAAVAAMLGQQRVGDQLGAMLAGAYSLHSTGEVTYDKAMEFIKNKDWQEERALQETKDELALLATIAEKIVRVDGLEGTPVERNFGEMVRVAAGFQTDSRMHTTAANERLKRLGFKVDGNFLFISTTSDQMRIWTRETAWAKNYHRTLGRIPGAEMVANARFASGIQSRAVKVPLTYFK